MADTIAGRGSACRPSAIDREARIWPHKIKRGPARSATEPTGRGPDMGPPVPGSSMQQPLQEGTRLAEAGRPDEAFALFDQVLAGSPRNAEAISWVGTL